MELNFMGIDQHGATYHNLGPHPRKGLEKKLGVAPRSKIYQDKTDGRTVHVGYIVAGLWVTLYKVERFEQEEK